jgi:uncharacterized protein YeaO (DUF488 family)
MKKPAPKRVYDPPEDRDGTRILVDRLWPRGIPRERAKVDLWLKDIAPSHALRKRFHGKPDDWEEFRAAYFAELESEAARAAAEELLGHLRKGPVTLLYAARDEQHNNAVALKEWLERHQGRAAVSESLTGLNPAHQHSRCAGCAHSVANRRRNV